MTVFTTERCFWRLRDCFQTFQGHFTIFTIKGLKKVTRLFSIIKFSYKGHVNIFKGRMKFLWSDVAFLKVYMAVL